MRSQEGFSLVEVMVAMVILLIGLVGITGQWPAGTKLIILSGQENEATIIAERFLEELQGTNYPEVERMRSGERIVGQYRLTYTINVGPVPNTTEVNTVVSWYYLVRMYSVSMGTVVAADL
jgi:prepilin-type N-terminal cleavage/methylation domain-containing protein